VWAFYEQATAAWTELNWIYWAHLQPWGAELLNKLYNNTTICHPRVNKNFKTTTEIVPWSGSTCCAPVQCPPLVRILEAASDVYCIAHSEQTLGAYLKTHRHTVSARNVQDTIFGNQAEPDLQLQIYMSLCVIVTNGNGQFMMALQCQNLITH